MIETLPTFKFRNTAGKEMLIGDLAGLARSVQASTSLPQGVSLDERDVKFIEGKFLAVQAEMNAMLGQLAKISEAPAKPVVPSSGVLTAAK